MDGVPSDTFTQQDILDGVVELEHDGSDGNAGVVFEVSNGQSVTPPLVLPSIGSPNPGLVNNVLSINQVRPPPPAQCPQSISPPVSIAASRPAL